MGKKGGKKGKGKGKGKDPKSKIPKEDQVDELSKQFYLVKIRDLTEKVARRMEECAKLEALNHEYQSSIDTSQGEKKTETALLRKELEDKTDTVASLHETLNQLNEQAQLDAEQAFANYKELECDRSNQIVRLQIENRDLANELHSLEEFKIHQTEIEKENVDLADTVEQAVLDGQVKVQHINGKGLKAKERLKKDMINRVKRVASDFRRASSNQMAQTTKNLVQENLSVNAQLSKLGDNTADIHS